MVARSGSTQVIRFFYDLQVLEKEAKSLVNLSDVLHFEDIHMFIKKRSDVKVTFHHLYNALLVLFPDLQFPGLVSCIVAEFLRELDNN